MFYISTGVASGYKIQRSNIVFLLLVLVMTLQTGCNSGGGVVATTQSASNAANVSSFANGGTVNSPPALPVNNYTNPSLDASLRQLITINRLSGDPSTGRNLPSINSPKAQLGMKLFYSKALGGGMDTACVSCHHPMLGGGDGLSLSVGADALIPDMLGPGREHSSTGMMYDGTFPVPRNAQTTFNAGMWDWHMFHDGRIESINKSDLLNGAGDIRTPDTLHGITDPYAGNNLPAAQARFPVSAPAEMRGFYFESGGDNQAVRNHIERRFQGTIVPTELPLNNWLPEFRKCFNDPYSTATTLITFDHMMDAIGEYERSQVFVDTPWRRFVQGDNSAISQQAKEGAVLFYTPVDQGGANCFACHSGDFFTDEQFHVVGMPQVGRGKGDFNGLNGSGDFGRFRETSNPDEKFAFRTPTLLNVEVTGPWGHAGSYTTLEAAVRHYISPQAALDSYHFLQLSPMVTVADLLINTQQALDQLTQLRANGNSLLVDAPLGDAQIAALLAFLTTLTDPCVKDRTCLAPWIPDHTVADPDGLRLNGIDRNGQLL